MAITDLCFFSCDALWGDVGEREGILLVLENLLCPWENRIYIGRRNQS